MGGSFDAFKWAKDNRIGNSSAKLVLMMMGDKANQRFEVYDAKTVLARDCEMSKRTLDAQILYLVQHGFVTQIDRVRSKGTDATPLWVLNHPEAPHVLGDPVTLDYKGNFLYPRYPDQLRAAGIEWISGGVQGAEHSKYPSTPHPAAGETPGEPRVQDLHPTRVQDLHPEGAGSAPSVGAGSAPLISTQQGSHPTNPGRAAGAAGVVGGSERTEKTPTESASSGSSTPSSPLPDTAGARFLQAFTFQGRRFSRKAIRDLVEHVDALLDSGWTEQGITDAITDTTGVEKVTRPLGFVRQKLDGLAPKQKATPKDPQAQVDALIAKGNAGAQKAAGLLGEFWDPEQYRGHESAQTWIMQTRPRLAAEFIEARRAELAAALDRSAA